MKYRHIKFKTSMLRSGLCDQVIMWLAFPNTEAVAAPSNRNKKLKLKNCAPLSKISTKKQIMLKRLIQ